MADKNHVYKFGDDEDTSLRGRIIDFVVKKGVIGPIILTMLNDEKRAIQIRQFVYEDDELRKSFHKWLADKQGWPIQPNEDDFWNLKFAKWFAPERQQEILREWFTAEIEPLLKGEEDD